MNRITCVGFKLKRLEYSSLYLTKPPNPEGRLTLLDAIL
jgi:hypothetical protein